LLTSFFLDFTSFTCPFVHVFFLHTFEFMLPFIPPPPFFYPLHPQWSSMLLCMLVVTNFCCFKSTLLFIVQASIVINQFQFTIDAHCFDQPRFLFWFWCFEPKLSMLLLVLKAFHFVVSPSSSRFSTLLLVFKLFYLNAIDA
jgi:hypothetical protein